jgi:uncharacterized membrane protein YcaP (DUF421 family)
MELLNDLLGLDQKDLDWYQMAIRAFFLFFIALLLIRIAGMRAFGTRTAFDTVLTITIGALLSRCISGHYPLLSCLAGAFTLALVTRTIAYLSCRYESIRKITEGQAVILFKNGTKDRKQMNKAGIHDKDLERSLRENNTRDYTDVESIWYETNGKINVIKKK